MKTKRGVLVMLLVVLVIVCVLGIYCVEGFKAATAPAKEPMKETHGSDPHPVMPTPSANMGGGGNVSINGNTIALPGRPAVPYISKVCNSNSDMCRYTLANGENVVVNDGKLIGTAMLLSTSSNIPSSSSSQPGTKTSVSPANSIICPNGESSTTGCCPNGEPKGDYPCCPDGSRSRKGKCFH